MVISVLSNQLSRGPAATSDSSPAPPRATQQVSSPKQAPSAAPERASGSPEDVEQLNQLMQQVRRELRFVTDENTGEMVIRVIDAETNEVVRQIPPEDVLRLMEHLRQNGQSLMLDTTA